MNISHKPLFTLGLTCLISLIGLSGCFNTSKGSKGDGSSGAALINDEIVARVNGESVTHLDIEAAASIQGLIKAGEHIPSDNDAYTELLDRVIEQKLLSQKAEALGFATTADAKRRLMTAKERILGNIMLEQHIAKTVTEQGLRELYEAQMKLRPTAEEIRASHILVKTEDEAKDAAKRINGGESFAVLAAQVSLDNGSRLNDGDLGYFLYETMVPDFSKIVFALEDNKVSDPFETQMGWHVAIVKSRRTAPVPSFDDLKGELKRFMTYEAVDKLMADLRREADIVTLAKPKSAKIDETAAEPLSKDP